MSLSPPQGNTTIQSPNPSPVTPIVSPSKSFIFGSSNSSSSNNNNNNNNRKKDKKEKKKDSHRSPLISILDLLDKPRQHGRLSRSTSSHDFRESITINRTDSTLNALNAAATTTTTTNDIPLPSTSPQHHHQQQPQMHHTVSSASILNIPPPPLPPPSSTTTTINNGEVLTHSTGEEPLVFTPHKRGLIFQEQDIRYGVNNNNNNNNTSVYAITSPRHRKGIRETKETLSPLISAVSNTKITDNNNNNNNQNDSQLSASTKNGITLTFTDINNSTNHNATDNNSKKTSEESALLALEKSAALQEQAFCEVLDVLLTGYMEPIRAQIAADYAEDPSARSQLVMDVTPIFDGLANLCRAARAQAEAVAALTKRNAHFWIVKAYAESADYVAAYRSFLAVHRRAIERLAALRAPGGGLLARYVREAGEALLKSKKSMKSQYAACAFEDLMRFCVARLSYISNLAKVQYSIVTALKTARETCIVSDLFSITCRVK